ncbi:MAG: PEP-CTERM sorting domain-containing protein [Deltaproteobacteria bacterium]|nr:PEP-CTERM sorting domain-containing protein [Deltaproteobacteria bacterium]
MKTGFHFILLFTLLTTFPPADTIAGPYPPAAGEEGSHAIHMDNAAFESWAADYKDYVAGSNVDDIWQTPEKALGHAIGSSDDIVCLGRQGRITLIFDPPIEDGEGWDFAIFENSFSNTFLELAYVMVSSNGLDFVRFDNDSLTAEPVSGFGSIDPTDIDGFAGKYRQAFGTPFDLHDLAEKDEVISGNVDLSSISYIKIKDIVGDGTCFDTDGDPVYDPYPTFNSAGFDLDAIGVSNGAPYPGGGNGNGGQEPPPQKSGKSGIGGNGGCFISTLFPDSWTAQ